MQYLTVKEILKVTNGELIKGNPEIECKTFSKDTRTIQKGDTYIAIKGEKFNGNQFIKQAFEKGAQCAIISELPDEKEIKQYKNKTIIKVKDTLQALYEIAKQKRKYYQIPVIAITGSVGKTSTKDLVASVISQKYKTLKTIGNNNNNIGLPFTILKLQDEEAIVLEMGMNHFGEISLLSDIAKPNICIITNIGTSHIGNLGSRENILKAKLEILEKAQNPTIIINKDNDLLQQWYEKNKKDKKIITYGIKEKSDKTAQNIKLKEKESQFECEIKQEKTKITVPIGGEHFILNSLCAICVGEALNIEAKQIKKGIEQFKLTEKRMDITQLENGIKIINDAYNASLESMQASLQYLAGYKNNRKIAVLGDMLELGKYSQELHEKVGKSVAENKIDLLFSTGEKSKDIVKKAKQSGMQESKIFYYEKKEKMVEQLKKQLQPGDVILLKASNGMKFFEIEEELKKVSYKKIEN